MKERLELTSLLIMQLQNLMDKCRGGACISCADNSAELVEELGKLLDRYCIKPSIWVERTCALKWEGVAEIINGNIRFISCFNQRDVLAIGASCVLVNEKLDDATI